jgi:hypothetical protein
MNQVRNLKKNWGSLPHQGLHAPRFHSRNNILYAYPDEPSQCYSQRQPGAYLSLRDPNCHIIVPFNQIKGCFIQFFLQLSYLLFSFHCKTSRGPLSVYS